MRCALALALGGCWTATTVEPRAVPEPAPASTPRVSPVVRHAQHFGIPRHSVWSGTYTCSQGLTGARLTIDLEGNLATVVFEFFADASNPTVPSGTSRLKGPAVENVNGSVTIDADPDAWISQPPGYYMVGVTATTDASLREMHGIMKSPTCGPIDLVRR